MNDPKTLVSAATCGWPEEGQPIPSPQAAPSPELGVWPLKQVGNEREKQMNHYILH